MGRTFTTNFEFQGHTYSTNVYMTRHANDLDIYFHIPDESLHELLPSGKMSYNSRKGLMDIHTEKQILTQELVGCMVRAVEQHIDA